MRPQASTPPAAVAGIVESINRNRLVGWISVPKDHPDVPITLHAGRLLIASTFPTADAPISRSVVRQRHDEETGARRRQGVASPRRDDRRNSGQQVRAFSFQIAGLWDFLGRRTRLSVRVGGQPLPIAGHGMFLTPRHGGNRELEELEELLAGGYQLTKSGYFVAPQESRGAWRNSVVDLYSRTRAFLADTHGYEAFLFYGSLLGSVREGGPIGHDNDFDCAYISRHRNGRDAGEELVEIALDLIKAGLNVDLRSRLLHINDPASGQRVDVFHGWFDESGVLQTAWGTAGTTAFTESDWQGTEEVDFAGGKVLRPVAAEKMVAHLYGDDWRQPKPGFNWALSRTDAAGEGRLSVEQRTKVYWANFYARTGYAAGSTFFEFVNAHPAMPATVIDIGCGDGRDSRAFGGAGRRVLGLDQSPVGIENARQGAVEAGLGETVRFEVCDVADVDELGRVLDEGVEDRQGPILFYLRFFLHAINEEIQERLMAAIATHARPGDVFAAEFRTDKDESATKVHGNHYRRFQNAVEFRESLTKFGFGEVLFEVEDTGLSPYGEEDPVLYRVIARADS
ncbi:class I SAM-dependent methyltransferase [Nocardioides sp. Bht2]|uniref:class I SAM-dependent methyltransferase n=1 Tax=Nocardioides sp. Bht2 TaxID=3392297 RepID=UPI0039B426D9